MASIGLGFTLSANAQQMASGINAGVTELQKLGYAAKKTAADVATLRNIEIGRAFISAVQTVTSTFTNFTSGAAQAVDSTLKLSRSLGISYQELRTLQLAADLSGASSEQLATAFTRAQLTITKAGQGSKESVAALRQLGLTVDDLANKSVTEQFSALGAAINRIQDPAQRAAAAVAIFGKSGAQLLPVFQGLPDSLKQAQGFLDQFKGGLTEIQAGRIEQLNDAFTLAGQGLQELAGQLLAELQPALQAGAEQFVRFASQIDVGSAARAVEAALGDVVDVVAALAQFAAPLARNLLPAIGGYLAFINRQAIAFAATQIAQALGAAAASALAYSGAAKQAAAATAVLGTAIRGLLISTGVGAVVVLLGVAAGALIDWGLSGQAAAADVVQGVDGAADGLRAVRNEADAAAAAAGRFADEVKKSLKVPAEITQAEFAQSALDQARSAIVELGRDLGGLDRIPQSIVDSFQQIAAYAGEIDERVMNEGQSLQIVEQQSRAVLAQVKEITQAREAEKKATEAVAQAAQKASEEAAKRVREIIDSGLTDQEKSRLKYNQDLLAIQQTIADAEKTLAEARKTNDLQALSAAEQRLQLVKETANVAAKSALQQKQERDTLTEKALLKPTETVRKQLENLKKDFDAGRIGAEQANNAFARIVEKGAQVRKELQLELSRPSQKALTVSDIRTQDGAAEFFRLATGRQDPALQEMRTQLAELRDIKKAIKDVFPTFIVELPG